MTDELIQQIIDTPTTQVFRKLRDVIQDDLTNLYKYFKQDVESITEANTRAILTIAESYRTVVFHIAEDRISSPPYPNNTTRQMSCEEYRTHIADFDSVQSRYIYFLKTYLPDVRGKHFFIIVKYEFLSPLNLIKTACELILLGRDVKDIFSTVLPCVHDLEAIIRATADYEEQLFGS